MATDAEITELVRSFPAVFETAVSDWAKYQAVLLTGKLEPWKREQITAWFYEFPRFWATIRPNWEQQPDGSPATIAQRRFAEKVNRWIIRLRGYPEMATAPGLGVATIIIAGILIAAAATAAGAVWAVGYVQEQRNISNMIDQVAKGALPASVLKEAVREAKSSIFGGLGNLGTFGSVLLIAGLLFLVPIVFKNR